MGSKFKKVRRGGNKTADLDITSLMDIITILLVFLLQSYNTTDLNLEVAKELALPLSNAETLGSNAVIIQVNQNKQVFLDAKYIGTLSDADNEQLVFLEQALIEHKNSIQEKEKDRVPAAEGAPLAANLVIDKSVPYKYIKKIMQTAIKSGHGEFRFIVQTDA